MKKLKCESCGGDVEIDENKEFATCPFCKTRYQLNETKNVYIRMDEDLKKATLDVFNNTQKIGKGMGIFFGVIFVVVLSIIVFGFINVRSSSKQFDINRYNSTFEFYKGTNPKTSISPLLDEIIQNNKKNDRKITVVFNDINTTNSDEIASLKQDLKESPYEYEIKIDYDDKGYVNKVTIVDFKDDSNKGEK